jgi:hypothetical protein
MTRPDRFWSKFSGKNDYRTKNCHQNNVFNENLSGLSAKMRIAGLKRVELDYFSTIGSILYENKRIILST